MTDHAHELRRYARKIVPFFAGDVPAVMLAAADEIERLQGVIAGHHNMTRDEIIRTAREAGDDVEHTLPSDLDFLERFARLVAAAEREACARICEDRQQQYNTSHYPQEIVVIRACAAAIRARGDA